jgi:dipeptidyl aminopeptidase/acylaminoacyl peptidase
MLRRLPAIFLMLTTAFAQYPENLTTENLPAISQEMRRNAARYLEFRSAGFRSWHPQRREMLITTRFGDSSQLHWVKMPGGARRQITFLPEPVSGGTFQPRRGECIVFLQDSGGGEFYQIHRLDPADGKATLLTDGKSRNVGVVWSPSGRQFAYSSTRRTGKDSDIRVMRPMDPSSDREVLAVEGGGWHALAWSPDETHLLIGEYLSANESRLHLLDLTNHKLVRVSPEGSAPVSWLGGAFAADGRSVFTATDSEGEFRQLARLDLGTKAVTMITGDIPWDVDEFDLSPDGARLAIATNEEGLSVLRIHDARTGRRLQQPRIPAGVISSVRWHEDNQTLGFSLDSARSPTDAWSLDAQSGELTRWTESETGGLDASQFAEPTLLRIASFDGLAISGFLYRPDPARFPGPRPCLFVVHGGPEGQSQPGFLGRYNYFLEEMGIALFFPNIRGSIGYGKTFLTLDNGYKREDSIKDIGAFIDALSKDRGIDPGRIGVSGGSYGGYVVLASMIHFGERIRCGISTVGISNFLTFLQNTQDYRRDLRRVEYGDERDPEMRAFLERISPTARAHEIRRPLFVVQGKNDPRVPVTEARQMVQAVRAAGGAVSYLEAADEGHGFAKKKNADVLFLATAAFLQEHLLEPAAP